MQLHHPGDRKQRQTERQKAIKLCKEQKQKEKNGHWVKVEGGDQNLMKFVEHGKDV
jgi:hypothetical protein